VLVVERNFAKFPGEVARDYFGKRHEPDLRVGWHGEVALEGSGAVSSADPGAEYEGVAAVEGDSWLDED
jgi:predicted nucleic acid-binding protein